MSKKQSDCPDRSLGARPIRKKGYHRALKRGEFWARLKNSTDHLMSTMAQQFVTTMRKDFLDPLPLSKILDKE